MQAGAGVDFGEEGCLINPVEAFFDVSIQDIFGFMAHGCEQSFDGILTGASRSKAIAVWGKACFPFGFERAFDQCLASAVMYGRDVISRLYILSRPLWERSRSGIPFTPCVATRFRSAIYAGWEICSHTSWSTLTEVS